MVLNKMENDCGEEYMKSELFFLPISNFWFLETCSIINFMNASLQNYYSQPKNFKKLIWDYEITPGDFFAILKGENKTGAFNQNWAIARVLQNLNYYDAIEMVSINLIKDNWDNLKNKLYPESLRRGYEFVLQQHSLSASR